MLTVNLKACMYAIVMVVGVTVSGYGAVCCYDNIPYTAYSSIVDTQEYVNREVQRKKQIVMPLRCSLALTLAAVMVTSIAWNGFINSEKK